MSKRYRPLPRNARGGLDCSGVKGSPVVPEDLDRATYSGSTACPEGECGHLLSEQHWHPTLEPSPRPMGKNTHRRRTKGRRK